MPNQRAPIEFNSVSGGIITEASPLTFPDGASIDEVNFTITSNGIRRRRLGLEVEADATENLQSGLYVDGTPSVVSSFLWENVSGQNNTALLVVQVDRKINVYATGTEVVSKNLLWTYTIVQDTIGTVTRPFHEKPYGFASVDGTLVIVTGNYEILTVVANLSVPTVPSFQVYPNRLTIRDLFGVTVKYDRAAEGGSGLVDLTSPEYTNKRPLAAGLPNVDPDDVPVDVTTANTVDIVTVFDLGKPAFGGGDRTQTVHTYGKQGAFAFTEDNVNNHVIVGITTGTWTIVEESSFIGGGTTTGVYDSIVEFYTVPTFSSFGLLDNRTGKNYTFTRGTGDGRKFTSAHIPEWTGQVPLGFDLTITTGGAVLQITTYAYNLRNQTFAVKRLPKTTSIKTDPVQDFLTASGKYPSMSDTVISALYPNVELQAPDSNTVDRFHAEDLLANPLGSSPAPKGYFIIDALERAESRETRWTELVVEEGLVETPADLPPDTTPAGATTVSEYGGRMWYGGFSEEGTVTVEGGTRLESYVLFSQLASNKSALTRCYQTGDPTAVEEPELLATDGGFLSIDGAYGIKRLANIGTALIVMAENGIWAVSGEDGNYFTPLSPRVSKINDKGCLSASSIVIVDSTIIYWASDGIYSVDVGSLGEFKQDNITEKTIQTLYSSYDYNAKSDVVGAYDPYRNAVDWVIYNTVNRSEPTEVLTLKTDTGAFTRSVIENSTSGSKTLTGFATLPPYVIGFAATIITAEGINVTVTEPGQDPTTVNTRTDKLLATTTTSKAVVIAEADGGVPALEFGDFSNTSFKDWGEVDAAGYIVTGYVSGGDFQRYKKTPYVTFHFNRTEDGFITDESGDMVPTNESGCLVQVQWDWANSVTSGRWSKSFQAYRYRRMYMPGDISDTYDYGFSTIVTKNKVRGKGRVLSMKVATEPDKDCRLIGWSAIMEVNTNV